MTIRENIEVSADTSKAQAGARSLEKSFTGSMIKSQLAVQALNKVLDLTVSAIRGSISAAVDYEKTNLKLSAALRNQGLEVTRNQAVLNRQSDALERLTGISDENIRTTQALALNMGISIEEVDKFTRASISLSNTLGIDVESAMRQLIQSQSGMKGQLGRLIPAVQDMTTEQLKNGEAIDIVNESMGENLTLLNQGAAGAYNRASNAFASFGEALVVAATGAGNLKGALDDIAAAIENVNAAINVGGIGALFAILSGDETGQQSIINAMQSEATSTDGVIGRSPRGGAASQAGAQRGARGGGITFGAIGEGFNFDEDFGTNQSATMEAMLGPLSQDAQGEQLDRRREFSESLGRILEEDQRNQSAIVKKGTDERSEVVLAGQQRIEQFAMAGGAAIADIFTALASGQKVVLEAMVKDFLLAQGNMLLAEGFGNILKAAAMAFWNPVGAAGLATSGAAMVAFGGTLTAGAAAIQAPGGGSGGAGGFTTTSEDQLRNPNNRRPDFNGGDVTINVVGDLSDDDAIRISRAINRSSGRGFS
jgi:hypothetical protein